MARLKEASDVSHLVAHTDYKTQGIMGSADIKKQQLLLIFEFKYNCKNLKEHCYWSEMSHLSQWMTWKHFWSDIAIG